MHKTYKVGILLDILQSEELYLVTASLLFSLDYLSMVSSALTHFPNTVTVSLFVTLNEVILGLEIQFLSRGHGKRGAATL